MPYAIIRTGGKQFFVERGSTIRVPSIGTEPGKSIELEALLSNGNDGDSDKPVVGASQGLSHSR